MRARTYRGHDPKSVREAWEKEQQEKSLSAGIWNDIQSRRISGLPTEFIFYDEAKTFNTPAGGSTSTITINNPTTTYSADDAAETITEHVKRAKAYSHWLDRHHSHAGWMIVGASIAWVAGFGMYLLFEATH